MARPATGHLILRKRGYAARIWRDGKRICIDLDTFDKADASEKMKAYLSGTAARENAYASFARAEQCGDEYIECPASPGAAKKFVIDAFRRGWRIFAVKEI